MHVPYANAPHKEHPHGERSNPSVIPHCLLGKLCGASCLFCLYIILAIFLALFIIHLRVNTWK